MPLQHSSANSAIPLPPHRFVAASAGWLPTRARRRGVGLALVQHVEQLAARQGVASLVVTTANHRTETHQFYDKLGYSWTGRRYAKDLARDQPR